MKKLTPIFIFVLLVGVVQISQAQFRMAIGSGIGMNLNLHGGSDLSESGSGFGVAFAAKADMSFDNARSLGVIFGLAFYDGRGGSSTNTGTQNGVNYTQDNDVSLAYFQIETLFRYRLHSGMYFMFGPQIGFNETAENEQTTTITTQGYTFNNGSTSQKSKNTIKDANTRFELKAGAGYDIPLSKLITLSPELSFGMGLTNVIKDTKYHVHTIQLMVVCKFDII